MMKLIPHKGRVSWWTGMGVGIWTLLLMATPAWAHKIYLHAEAVGQKVQGRAYFRGGAPAQQSKLEVFLPDGRKLLETKTDANGEFAFQAPSRCDYRLVVDTGDGHGAEYTLPAADLPESLPPLEKATLPPAEKAQNPPDEKSPPTAHQKPASRESGQVLPQEKTRAGAADPLPEWIEQAVHRQIAPLARKIEQMEDRIRWSDVLGGIGYIIGLTGMGFYLLGMRRSGLLDAEKRLSAGSGSTRSPEVP